MFFKGHKKISAETLIDLKRYIDLCYPRPVEREESAPLEDSADFAGAMRVPQPAKPQTGRRVNKKSAQTASAPYAAAYTLAAFTAPGAGSAAVTSGQPLFAAMIPAQAFPQP